MRAETVRTVKKEGHKQEMEESEIGKKEVPANDEGHQGRFKQKLIGKILYQDINPKKQQAETLERKNLTVNRAPTKD